MVDREIVDRIKEEVDIVDLIGSYIPLKRVGSYYRALCPFHTEKTPSFYVHPEKKIYHCFGCGASGDVITFLMKYKGLSFIESVKELASLAGIDLDLKNDRSYKLYDVNRLTASFYNDYLLRERPEKVMRFIEERGIKESTLRRFMLGYAPSLNRLIQYLLNRNIPMEDMIEAGVVYRGTGVVKDFFSERVIFPIENMNGRIVGFGGRTLGDEQPKYINTRETSIFKKSRILYNMGSLKNGEGEPILVEGYMDVISLYQEGFRKVVAPLGTALTVYHARFIRKYGNRILICFDSDQAGIKATERTIPILLKEGLHPYIVSMPEGEDPDSFIRKYGVESFRDLVKGSKDFMEWKLERGMDEDGIRDIVLWIDGIQDGIEREGMFKRLSQITGYSIEALKDVKKEERGIRMSSGMEDEVTILSIIVQDRNYVEYLRENVPLSYFKNEKVRRIIESIVYDNRDAWMVIEEMGDSHIKDSVGKGAFMSVNHDEVDYILRRFKIKREREELKRRIEEIEKGDGSEDELKILLKKMEELKKEESYEQKKSLEG